LTDATASQFGGFPNTVATYSQGDNSLVHVFVWFSTSVSTSALGQFDALPLALSAVFIVITGHL
jgi:hypothetical protein